MLTLFCAAVLMSPASFQKLPNANDYRPAGPKVVFTMANGRSFTITTDPKNSPKTVAHILGLVRKGFYDGQRVHRVEHWVTQWGAPASRNEPLDVKDPKTGKMKQNERVGDGGSGKDISKFEMSEVDYYRGVVGIASNGLQLPGDSQLFVLKKDTLRLYHSYAVVGKVTQGMSVVDAIKRGDRFRSARVVK
jgi:cyclophilin family peptidyl-prolyl cis-trans isomerase